MFCNHLPLTQLIIPSTGFNKKKKPRCRSQALKKEPGVSADVEQWRRSLRSADGYFDIEQRKKEINKVGTLPVGEQGHGECKAILLPRDKLKMSNR